MLKIRTLVMAAFAVAGATLAVVGVPNLLDTIYDAVRVSSSNSLVDVDNRLHLFMRIAYQGPTAKDDANADLENVKQGKPTFDELCKKSGLRCEEVKLSDKKVKDEEHKALALLRKSGEVAVVANDPAKSEYSLYELKAVEKVIPVGGSVVGPPAGYPNSRDIWILIALALIGAMFGGGLGNLAVKSSEAVARGWEGMETGDRVNLFLGTVVGIIGSLPFLIAFGNLGPYVASLLTLGLTLGFSALSVYALNSMQEVLPWKKGEVRGRRSGIKILDTNVLIDGRIYDLARTGFLEGDIYVPKFVLKELQHIADSPDPMRRQRGRRGLDVLRHIQADHVVEIGDHDRFAPDEMEEVDSRLVKLAKALGADLISNDYNLNRVASIQDVRVLNINDLALSLRPNVLPGETLELSIIREGSQPGQGVGYLDDGTMVVVENAKAAIGEQVEVTVTQVIQTERGKMIFGSYGENDDWRQNGNRR